MSRRREALDLERALYLSTQEHSGVSSPGNYLFSSTSDQTDSGYSREMEMRPVVGGVLLRSGSGLMENIEVETVNPRDVMRAPESSGVVSEDAQGGKLDSGDTSMTDEIESFSRHTPSAFNSHITDYQQSATHPPTANPAVIPSSSSDGRPRQPTVPSISVLATPAAPSHPIASLPPHTRNALYQSPKSSESSQPPQFTPTYRSGKQGVSFAELSTQGASNTGGDTSRIGSAALPLEIVSSPAVQAPSDRRVRPVGSRCFLSSDDEIEDQVEARPPTSRAKQVSSSTNRVQDSVDNGDKGKDGLFRKSSRADFAEMKRRERDASPDPLRLVAGTRVEGSRGKRAATDKAKAKLAKLASIESEAKRQMTRGISESPSVQADSGRRVSSRAQGLAEKKEAEEQAAKAKRRADRARDKAEKEEAERTGRDLKDIQRERKRRDEAAEKAAAKLRRRSPDTTDEEEEQEEEEMAESVTAEGGYVPLSNEVSMETPKEKAVEGKLSRGLAEKDPQPTTSISREMDESLKNAVRHVDKASPSLSVKSKRKTPATAKNTTTSAKGAAQSRKKRRIVDAEEDEEVEAPAKPACKSPAKPVPGSSRRRSRTGESVQSEKGCGFETAEDEEEGCGQDEESKNAESATKAATFTTGDKASMSDTPARSPLKAIPARINAVVRHSPGPVNEKGTPLRPGGISFKTERSDLPSLLSAKYPGSRLSGMSRRHRIAPLHSNIGPPKKELAPAPVKMERNKKGDSDDDDGDEEEERDADDEEGGGGKRGKKGRGMEWFMVEDDGF